MYFYLANIDSKTIEANNSGQFISMRVKAKDILKVTDFKGCLADIEIVNVNKKTKELEYKILDKKQISNPLKFNLFQAITDKVYLEKLFEIVPHGLFANVYLWQANNSPKQNLNLNRLESILIRSCGQAQICHKPNIQILKNNDEIFNFTSRAILLHTKNIVQKSKTTNSKDLIVGPEGGFDDQEIEYFTTKDVIFSFIDGPIYPSWLAGFVASNKYLDKN